jgi:hypothetical protein
MSRKPNLAAALHEASGKKQAVAMLATANESAPLTSAGKPPSRAGKKVVAGHFDPAVIRQLKMLAMDNDSSIQSLLSEALNDLFEKHSMKPIA